MAQTCENCTVLAPIKKPEGACKVRELKITGIRIACEESISLVYADIVVPDTGCGATTCLNSEIVGITVVDPVACPTPFISVEITNETDLDEVYSMVSDDDDLTTRTYTLNPTVRAYDAIQQCVIESLEEQEISVVFKLEGLDDTNNYQFRHFRGKVRGVEGSIKLGYTLSIEIINPSDIDRPKWYIENGSVTDTENAIDAITQF